jgi:hypothetical protein
MRQARLHDVTEDSTVDDDVFGGFGNSEPAAAANPITNVPVFSPGAQIVGSVAKSWNQQYVTLGRCV